MFTVVVFSLTDNGDAYFHKLFDGPKQLNKMRSVFQMLLCYWAWLRKDYYWQRDDHSALQQAKQAIRKLMAAIVDLWPRTNGQGWEIPKFHE
jgi:hypothetical protein